MQDRLGASPLPDGRTRFLVWAPEASVVRVMHDGGALELAPVDHGYHEGAGPVRGTYRYALDEEEPLPDPASRHQPEGVHGPSAIVDPAAFPWTDEGWAGIPLADLVTYELHVGTFTGDGTLDAAIERLDALADLGVTAIELMPVAQFPGGRNWGYDGVFPSAVQDTYGGPHAYARFVDAAHTRGLGVIQDVVYNHLGPEGNVLPRYGPYFTDAYRTPWGDALNFDGPGSDEIRRYFIDSALWFLRDLHADGLRLDAIHGIVDPTARPFLAELSEAVDGLAASQGRRLHLIAETDANDPRVVAPRERGGLGIHAMWNDDLHHALHALLTGERDGYYVDFGSAEDLATALRDGFVFQGRRSTYRGRRHGAPSSGIPPERLVVYAQNHDQVGNRPRGRRLTRLLDFEREKLAAGLVLLSPYLPLLFMGEEYGEPAPFNYFVSHTDPELIEGVRRGRAEEFAAFAWAVEPPDPQDAGTFEASRLNWSLRDEGEHAALLALHRELLRLRGAHAAFRSRSRQGSEIRLEGDLLLMHRAGDGATATILFNLGERDLEAPREGHRVLDSADERWAGPGGADGILHRHAFQVIEGERGSLDHVSSSAARVPSPR